MLKYCKKLGANLSITYYYCHRNLLSTSVGVTEAAASSSVQCCCREAPLAQAWGQDCLIILCNAWNVSLMPVQKDKACKSQAKAHNH